MADRSWEEAEKGLHAACWTLARLRDQLESLEEDGASEHGEFSMAATETDNLLHKLQDLINKTSRRREEGPVSTPQVETFHKYIQLVPERFTWEEMLEHVAGEIPAGRVLLREAEPVPTRTIQELNRDAYAFLHFNPQLDLTERHELLTEERPANSFFPFSTTGKIVLKVIWHGAKWDIGSDYRPGEVRLTSDGVTAVRRFRHFFDMVYCLEQLPGVITPATISKLGFEVQRSRGPSNAPEGPVGSGVL